ncbi:MAG: hypothetical protein AMXMBFR36_03630 [Acidobacteriota bacterium]
MRRQRRPAASASGGERRAGGSDPETEEDGTASIAAHCTGGCSRATGAEGAEDSPLLGWDRGIPPTGELPARRVAAWKGPRTKMGAVNAAPAPETLR